MECDKDPGKQTVNTNHTQLLQSYAAINTAATNLNHLGNVQQEQRLKL